MAEKIIFGILLAVPVAAAAIADIRTKEIPDAASLAVFVFGVLRIFLGGLSPPSAFLGMLLCGCVVLFVSLTNNSIGGGDIKLYASTGFFLGLNGAFAALFLSLFLFLCFVFGLAVLRRFKKNEALALAPFIAAGALLTYIFIITGVIAA